MKIDKTTFCVAPWFEFRNDPMGEFNVCCQIEHDKSNFKGKKDYRWPHNSPEEFLNSDYVKYLRENLTGGNKLPECSKCWRLETLSNDSASLRKSLNNTYIDKSKPDWMSLYFKNKTDFSSNLLLYADITLNNTCNFSCITCNPAESSKIYTKWKKHKDANIVKKLINQNENEYFQKIDLITKSNEKKNLLHYILEFKPKTLKLLGGEPLIDKKNLNYLAGLDIKTKQNISLNFVTNGSKNLTKNDNMLGEFKNILYVISLEGVGKIQDYIREGSNWDTIKTNIEEYRKYNPTKHLSVSCLLQSLNAYHIDKLAKWCKELHIELNYIILDDPSFMSVKSIPPLLREKILDYYSKKTEEIKLDFNQLFFEMPFSETDYKDLLEFLNWNDPNENWKTLFPEWDDF